MRIALLHSTPSIGGAETFGLAAARVWRSSHDVVVANLWGGGGALKNACAAQEIPFVEIDGGMRLFRPGAPRKLRLGLKSFKPDVVLVFGLRLQLLTRVFRSYVAPQAVWITMLRGQDPWRNRFHILADRWTQHRFDGHVGCSRAICKLWATRECYPTDRLVYIPNGIDLSQFTPSSPSARRVLRDKIGLPATGLVCATVANMRPIKGYGFLVDTLVRYAAQMHRLNLSFLWLGDRGRQWDSLRVRLANAGFAGRVVAPGPVADVRPYLNASDLFILPSQSEGMPRALMEAMAMGLPAIATDVGGTQDVLRHERDGCLVAYGDCHGLAMAINRMASDPAGRSMFGDSARRRIETHFDIHVVAEEYERLFERLRDPALISLEARFDAYRSMSRYGSEIVPKVALLDNDIECHPTHHGHVPLAQRTVDSWL